jgi:hypothetical protein
MLQRGTKGLPMSTQELSQLEHELNRLITNGHALAAFDRYYADDVVMQENTAEPRVGKAANRGYEEEFFASIAEVHRIAVLATAIGDGVTLSEWEYDVTFRDGNRVTMAQVARRRWRNGKVVHERFYHS